MSIDQFIAESGIPASTFKSTGGGMLPVTAGIMGAGYIVNGIFQYMGSKKQEEENARVQKQNQKMFDLTFAWDKEKDTKDRLFAERGFKASKQEASLSRQERKKASEVAAEDKWWNRKAAIMGGLSSVLSNAPQMRDKMFNVWHRS